MKGLSDAVVAIFLIIIIISSLFPLIMIMNQRNIDLANQSKYENYAYFRNLYSQYINNGIIQISYSVLAGPQPQPQLFVKENVEIITPPLYVLNITGIFCLNQGKWTEVDHSYPIIIHLSSFPSTICLPFTVKGDILVLLNNGVMVFLAPGSSTICCF